MYMKLLTHFFVIAIPGRSGRGDLLFFNAPERLLRHSKTSGFLAPFKARTLEPCLNVWTSQTLIIR